MLTGSYCKLANVTSPVRFLVSLVMSACILEEFTTVTRQGPESPERRVTPAVCSNKFNLSMTWQKNKKYKSFLLLFPMIDTQMFVYTTCPCTVFALSGGAITCHTWPSYKKVNLRRKKRFLSITLEFRHVWVRSLEL